MQPSLSSSLILPCLLAVALAPAAPAQSTTRVSLTDAGAQAPTGHSESPSISADGRFVAFYTQAPGLVPGDTNGFEDVYVRDRLLGTTNRISVSSAGVGANAASDFPSISADGRYVAFRSNAFNLDPLDTTFAQDAFVHDRLTGTTKVVSIAEDGSHPGAGNTHNPSISANGVYVVFETDADLDLDDHSDVDVYVRHQFNNTTEIVSISTGSPFLLNGDSFRPSISGDGRFVVFASDAGNAVPGDTNAKRDIILRDRLLGQTTCVSLSSAGVQGNDHSDTPCISADGEWIAFDSSATNLVAGDTNGTSDVFLHQRLTGVTTRVSLSSAGAQGNLFSSEAALSSDGRYVVFQSSANNLVAGDTNAEADVFRHDRITGQTTRLSVATGGTQGNKPSTLPAISADGALVAFDSDATNLVPGDTNNRSDVFVHDSVGCAGGGAWIAYGTGLAGTGGHVPALSGSTCPLPGATVSLHLDDALGGATGALFFGTSSAAIPFKGGSFRVGGLFFILDLVAGGTPGSPGAGALDLQGTLLNDPILSGFSIFLQTGFADPAAVQQVSLSNGLQMAIG